MFDGSSGVPICESFQCNGWTETAVIHKPLSGKELGQMYGSALCNATFRCCIVSMQLQVQPCGDVRAGPVRR